MKMEQTRKGYYCDQTSDKKDEYGNVDKLLLFQCPFTWDMDEIDIRLETEFKPRDEEESMPILKLSRIIMRIFVNTKANMNPEIILNDLKEVDNVFNLMKLTESDIQISLNAVNHIIDATKYFVYMNYKFQELEQTIQTISRVNYDDKKFMNSIDICKSICWSVYPNKSQKVIEIIEKTIVENPNIDISYFILGKNLRRMRRDAMLTLESSEKEILAFKTAFDLSKNNAVFCLSVAQSLKEAKNYEEAIEYYEKVLTLVPNDVNRSYIYLVTALGFLNCRYSHSSECKRYFEMAKNCLDRVDKKCMDGSVFLHYMGIYYTKTFKFKKAAEYLHKSALLDNFGAAVLYINCMTRINKKYDYLNFLLEFEKNKKDLLDKRHVNLFLYIAFNYLEKKNQNEALKYFLKAIKLDPANFSLRSFSKITSKGFDTTKIDVYKLVDNLINSISTALVNKEMQDIIAQLKMYCINAAVSCIKI